jgi:hypothetical protein
MNDMNDMNHMMMTTGARAPISPGLLASASAVTALMAELGCQRTTLGEPGCVAHRPSAWVDRGCAHALALVDSLWGQACADLLAALVEAVEIGEDLVRYEPMLGHKFGYPGDLARLRAAATGRPPRLLCAEGCVDCDRYPQTFDPPMLAGMEGHTVRFDWTAAVAADGSAEYLWSWSCSCSPEAGCEPMPWAELDWRTHIRAEQQALDHLAGSHATSPPRG